MTPPDLERSSEPRLDEAGVERMARRRFEHTTGTSMAQAWKSLSPAERDSWIENARQEISAYLNDTPTWPTDDVLDAIWNPLTSSVAEREVARQRLRCGMLEDPIISAAIELVHSWSPTKTASDQERALQAAVREAGL